MARSFFEKRGGGVGGDGLGEYSATAAALAACTAVGRANTAGSPLATTIVVCASPATGVLATRLVGAASAVLAADAAELGAEATVTPLAAAEVVRA